MFTIMEIVEHSAKTLTKKKQYWYQAKENFRQKYDYKNESFIQW